MGSAFPIATLQQYISERLVYTITEECAIRQISMIAEGMDTFPEYRDSFGDHNISIPMLTLSSTLEVSKHVCILFIL